ncbi:MAG: hypothetical protein WCI05_02295 [Myxococcales bacterium]
MKTRLSLVLAAAGLFSAVVATGQSSRDAGHADAAKADAGHADAASSDAGHADAISDAAGRADTSPQSQVPDAGGATDGSVATKPQPAPPAPPMRRRTAPPLPPPTPEQVAAYGALKHELDTYDFGAREYKEAITGIITLHYEQKKKTILARLDRDIAIEREELRKARAIAIARLEEFVKKYSGDRSQPEATPDAMYRLAALYEEEARGLEEDLRISSPMNKAIALYKRVIREFPSYHELSGIHYFLGHALNDQGRHPEAQQVWRSIVCRSRYSYPTPQDPQVPEVDQIVAMPQDNSRPYWEQWRRTYYRPDSVKKATPETRFVDPYPSDCAPLAQVRQRPGDDPKYLAEIWWLIGNWEFDQDDLASGVVDWEASSVWGYNRAASAYLHAMQFKKPPLYGVALYKYAWTLFKQQRYAAATRELVRLLDYTDDQQKATGDPGTDFRSEAFTYIAGSLTNDDFVGPPADEPFVTREDIVQSRPTEAERILHKAVERVQDPNIVPQNKPWTIDVYRALALEYRGLIHYQSALEMYRLVLKRWPMDPGAPDTQNDIAEVYALLARATKIGSERALYEEEILKAQTALHAYVGETPWVDANKDNPAAIQRAEELVRTGLRSAAIKHTRNGQAAVDEAQAQADDRTAQLHALDRAASEYHLAALGWKGFLDQDEDASDAYRTRFFLADSLYQIVSIKLTLHSADPKHHDEPTTAEIDRARQAAIDVRDSDENDEFLENGAFYVVSLSDTGRDLAYQHFRDSNGTIGIEPRETPRLEGPDGEKKVVEDPIPAEILASMAARDDYIQLVPANLDTQSRAALFQFYSADQYYLYGQFKVARERFEPIYREHCGKDELGYEAWKRLILMSNLEKDATRSRELAEAEKGHSCAKTAAQKSDSKMVVDPTIQEAAFLDARRKFEEAQKAPPGPARDKLWLEAAGLYEAALKAAPGRDEAPEAVMNAAYAYKQIGRFDKAIELYTLFIEKYGSEENLNRLQKGGPDPKDPKIKRAPDPKRYKERVKYLGDAYDGLSSTYYGFFAYDRAAASYSKIARNERFSDEQRQNAARIALVLYSNLGDRAGMNAQYALLIGGKMKLPPDRRAEADFRRVDFDYNQWNPTGSDTGPNLSARRQAQAALNVYYVANAKSAPAARYVLEAAFKMARMAKSSGDATGYRTWLRNTIAAWEFFKTRPVTGPSPASADNPPYNDWGAEAEFVLVDEEIRRDFDYQTNHQRFSGTVTEVKAQYEKSLELAEKKYRPKLDRIAQTYQSFYWTPAAIARVGSLYDSLRTGLEFVAPQYFTPKQEKLLQRLDELGQAEEADKIRDQVRSKWREWRDAQLESAGTKMVGRYATAAIFARKNNVKSDAVQKGVGRLAFYTDSVTFGDDKMKKYVEETPDPFEKGKALVYTKGMFLQWRAGLLTHPAPSGRGAPLPVSP